MHPILFKLGPFTLYSYGAFVFLGFITGLLVLRWLAIVEGLDPKRVENGAILGFIVGFLGAKILYLITIFPEWIGNYRVLISALHGGLVFYGAPIALLPFLIWFVRHYNLPFWKVMDIVAISLVVGHAFGRIGCFFAGCCYGSPTKSSFGVTFNSGLVPFHLHGVPLHPTQLYESLFLFILFVFLFWLHRHRKFSGQILVVYIFCYSLFRFIIEFLRGDEARGFFLGGHLSTSQILSILFFFSGIITFFFLRIRAGRSRCCDFTRFS